MLIKIAPTKFHNNCFVDTYETREEAYQAMVERLTENEETIDEYSSFTVNIFVRGVERTYYIREGLTDFGTDTDRNGLEDFRMDADGGVFEFYKDTDDKGEIAIRESLGSY